MLLLCRQKHKLVKAKVQPDTQFFSEVLRRSLYSFPSQQLIFEFKVVPIKTN